MDTNSITPGIKSFVGQVVTVTVTGLTDSEKNLNETFKLAGFDDHGLQLEPIVGNNSNTSPRLFYPWTAIGCVALADNKGAQSRVA